MIDPPESRRASEPGLFPHRLGRYEVLLPIASGGMATVYLARGLGPDGFERDVALKLTHLHVREDPGFVVSVMDEARLAGQIRHPNVVSVLDVGEDALGVFIVMEYVEGDSLSVLWRSLRKREERMPLAVGLRLMDDLLRGLHAAHELVDDDGKALGLVHRDVTPHNVLLGIDGVTKLTDFGIAKAASRPGSTATGRVKGKIGYMAPEQAQGRSIDRRVDVWAAGVNAWELFAGTRLYDGSNDAAILLKIVREPPMRLCAINPEIPAAIESVVAKALALDASDRHESAETFAEALVAAARSAGMHRAERSEVTRFLQPLLGERLEERRAKSREVRALRQQSTQLGRLGASSRPSQPEPLLRRVEATRVTEVERSASTDHTQPCTAGSSTRASSVQPPRRRRMLAISAIAGAGLTAVVLGVTALDDGSEPAGRAAAASARPAGSAAALPARPAPSLSTSTASTASASSTAPESETPAGSSGGRGGASTPARGNR